MKRKTLPIPQHEFAFAAAAFRLFNDSTLDGERIARERAAAEEARRLADTAQAPLFASTLNPQLSTCHD